MEIIEWSQVIYNLLLRNASCHESEKLCFECHPVFLFSKQKLAVALLIFVYIYLRSTFQTTNRFHCGFRGPSVLCGSDVFVQFLVILPRE